MKTGLGPPAAVDEAADFLAFLLPAPEAPAPKKPWRVRLDMAASQWVAKIPHQNEASQHSKANRSAAHLTPTISRSLVFSTQLQ